MPFSEFPDSDLPPGLEHATPATIDGNLDLNFVAGDEYCAITRTYIRSYLLKYFILHRHVDNQERVMNLDRSIQVDDLPVKIVHAMHLEVFPLLHDLIHDLEIP
jgi:hypothetical protein